MNEQEDFLSPKHVRILNIALWAKYLAWVVLIVFTLWAMSEFFADMNIANGQLSSMRGSLLDFIGLFKQQPMNAISLLLGIVSIFFKGIIYFLVLNGISLGLNMIVETDINYRDSNQLGGVK
ncbi:MAG: hypothetical protein WBW94_16805 [Anaerolineales bacterium]